jgi:hypothetical protein
MQRDRHDFLHVGHAGERSPERGRAFQGRGSREKRRSMLRLYVEIVLMRAVWLCHMVIFRVDRGFHSAKRRRRR